MAIRVVVITASNQGTASRCLPALAEHPDIDVACVIRTERQYVNKRRKVQRDLKKIRKIGPLGAACGYFIRGWYAGGPTEDLQAVAARYGIPYRTSPLANGKVTVRLLKEADADLGLSLGNGLLFPRVYSVPRLGTINVHGELLPQFRGAASVMWNIYSGVTDTGLTIHQVDKNIDTGKILYQERFPIEFKEDLRTTVAHNCDRITQRVPAALVHVVTHYHELAASAKPQGPGQSFTTPTLRQFARMLVMHRRLSRAAHRRAQAPSS